MYRMLLRGQINWALGLSNWFRNMQVFFFFDNLEESLHPLEAECGKSQLQRASPVEMQYGDAQ